jgi:transcriptional regulator with XRE-family HTH domain
MKKPQKTLSADSLTATLTDLGQRIKRLRIARRQLQDESATRAGIARSTASRIESGDPSLAIGQIVRYLDAIVPGRTLAQLYQETDTAEALLRHQESRQRARRLSETEKKELDF